MIIYNQFYINNNFNNNKSKANMHRCLFRYPMRNFPYKNGVSSVKSFCAWYSFFYMYSLFVDSVCIFRNDIEVYPSTHTLLHYNNINQQQFQWQPHPQVQLTALNSTSQLRPPSQMGTSSWMGNGCYGYETQQICKWIDNIII